MITFLELVAYEDEHGARAARDLLLLGGPDEYEGNYDVTMAGLEYTIKKQEYEGGDPDIYYMLPVEAQLFEE